MIWVRRLPRLDWYVRVFFLILTHNTNISKCSQFIEFVSYDTANSITEDNLFYTSLEANTTGKKLILQCKVLINTILIDWLKYLVIYTNGAKAMVRHRNALIVRLQEAVLNATWLHSYLHQEALASCCFSELDCLEKSISRLVNPIKRKAVHTHTL